MTETPKEKMNRILNVQVSDTTGGE